MAWVARVMYMRPATCAPSTCALSRLHLRWPLALLQLGPAVLQHPVCFLCDAAMAEAHSGARYALISSDGSPAEAPVVGIPVVGPSVGAGASGVPHGGGGPLNNWWEGVVGEFSGLLVAAVGSGGEEGWERGDAVAPAFPAPDHAFWRRPDCPEKVLLATQALHWERCRAVAHAQASGEAAREAAEALQRANAAVAALQGALEAEQRRAGELESGVGGSGSGSGGAGAASRAEGARQAATHSAAHPPDLSSPPPGSAAAETEALRERCALLQSLLSEERARAERTAALAADAANGGAVDASTAMLTASLTSERLRSADFELRLQGWVDARGAASAELQRLQRASAEQQLRSSDSERRLRGEIEHLLAQRARQQDDMLSMEAVRHERASAVQQARAAAADVARLQGTVGALRAALKEEQAQRRDLEARLTWEGAPAVGPSVGPPTGPAVGPPRAVSGQLPCGGEAVAAALADRAAAQLAQQEVRRLEAALHALRAELHAERLKGTAGVAQTEHTRDDAAAAAAAGAVAAFQARAERAERELEALCDAAALQEARMDEIRSRSECANAAAATAEALLTATCDELAQVRAGCAASEAAAAGSVADATRTAQRETIELQRRLSAAEARAGAATAALASERARLEALAQRTDVLAGAVGDAARERERAEATDDARARAESRNDALSDALVETQRELGRVTAALHAAQRRAGVRGGASSPTPQPQGDDPVDPGSPWSPHSSGAASPALSRSDSESSFGGPRRSTTRKARAR